MGSTVREESNTANDLLQSNVDNQETSSEVVHLVPVSPG